MAKKTRKPTHKPDRPARLLKSVHKKNIYPEFGSMKSVYHANLEASQIATHCLWEMTYHGFEPSQIRAERDELKRRIDDLEAMTEEERKERLIPWEQVRKELEGKE